MLTSAPDTDPSAGLVEKVSRVAKELCLSYREATRVVLYTYPALVQEYAEFSRLKRGIDFHLSALAQEYRPTGFIADRILPVVQVSNPFGAGYHCNNFALKADVTLEDRSNADDIFVQQFEEGRVNRVQDALFLDWEIRVASLVTNPANVGESAGISNAWTDYLRSDPLGDVQEAIKRVMRKTGYRPNRVLFSGTAWRHFRCNHAVIDKAAKLAGGGLYPSTQQAQDMLGAQVLVGNAWYNAAEEALPLNLQQIWKDTVLVYYIPDVGAFDRSSFGYCFRWAAPGLPLVQVKRLAHDSHDEVEISYHQDERVILRNLGLLIRNVTRVSA